MIMRDYTLIDGAKVFTSQSTDGDYLESGFDELFKNEEQHFWFIVRKKFIAQCMQKHINKLDKIMEVGAGTGNVTRYLMSQGWQNISTGEMHLSALAYAKSYGIQERYCFNLLDTPFESEFDCICAFDVIEHIQDDELAMKSIAKSLKPNGKVCISVPALQSLWNAHDVDVGHKRRYDRKALRALLQNNGFEILEMKYFFICVTPLLFLRRLLHPAKPNQTPKGDNIQKENVLINKSLIALLSLENRLIPYLPNPFGGSLMAIARKV